MTPNMFDNSATRFFPRDLDDLKVGSMAALNVYIDKSHSEATLWYAVDMYLSVSAERMDVSYIEDLGRFLQIAGRDGTSGNCRGQDEYLRPYRSVLVWDSEDEAEPAD